MNPFWLSILGSIARTAITAAGTWGVAKGTVTQQDVDTVGQVAGALASGNGEVVSGALAIGVASAWSIWHKVKSSRG